MLNDILFSLLAVVVEKYLRKVFSSFHKRPVNERIVTSSNQTYRFLLPQSSMTIYKIHITI